MVLVCPSCQGSVGEESCSGCRRNVRFYICSNCASIVPNTKYASGITCLECGAQVFEHPHKGESYFKEWYVCQACSAFVKNTSYTGAHACSGCKPPSCNECGATTALHVGRQVEVCIECGEEYPHPV